MSGSRGCGLTVTVPVASISVERRNNSSGYAV
ncbi:hypothetical protein DFR74_103154 [Nocardia puris]|uniref:Uncharacterized protein n=1 Tax=Nocardia puris TaxID=208602 RepID=A0A366DQZ4_9NOCA|nr:hypothetical protein DFR74_103154 [Nocardia puris]